MARSTSANSSPGCSGVTKKRCSWESVGPSCEGSMSPWTVRTTLTSASRLTAAGHPVRHCLGQELERGQIWTIGVVASRLRAWQDQISMTIHMDMLEVVLDHSTPIPLYYQFKQWLSSRIFSVELAPGTRLPDEFELCERLGVSRGVVRQALTELCYEGLVHRQRGRGTFVSAPKTAEGLISGLGGLADDAALRGQKVQSRALGLREAPVTDSVGKRLNLTPGELVVELERVRRLDGEPHVLTMTYLPASMVPGLAQRDLNGSASLYQVLREDFGLPIISSLRRVEAATASVREALGIDQSRLPAIVEPGVAVGKLLPDVALELGLPASTTVCTGALDQACGAIGVGTVGPGRFSENTGAAVALCATLREARLDPERRMPCHYHGVPDTYMFHTFTSGGVVLRWFRDQFGDAEQSVASASGRDAYD